MDVVFAHADRVMVLARGRVLAEGPPQAIRDNAQVQQVYLGSGSMSGAAPASMGMA
jgi:branched-chain amino acid transport system ATP-binding protein